MNGLNHVHCLKLFVDATRHSSLLSFSMNQQRHMNCFVFEDVYVSFMCLQHLRSSLVLVGFVLLDLQFSMQYCVDHCFFFQPLHVFCMFFSVRCTASYYLFGIFKFILSQVCTFDQSIVRVNKTNRYNLCVALDYFGNSMCQMPITNNCLQSIVQDTTIVFQ